MQHGVSVVVGRGVTVNADILLVVLELVVTVDIFVVVSFEQGERWPWLRPKAPKTIGNQPYRRIFH